VGGLYYKKNDLNVNECLSTLYEERYRWVPLFEKLVLGWNVNHPRERRHEFFFWWIH